MYSGNVEGINETLSSSADGEGANKKQHKSSSTAAISQSLFCQPLCMCISSSSVISALLAVTKIKCVDIKFVGFIMNNTRCTTVITALSTNHNYDMFHL